MMKTKRHALFLPLIHYVIILASQTCMATFSVNEKTDDDLSPHLIEWLRANGAMMSDKVEVRNVIPGDPMSPRGVFALNTLEEGEVICSIPWDLIVKPEEDPKTDDWACGTVDAAVKAMSNESITPYGKYLLEQPQGYLPAFWSTEGQALLSEMLGPTLPPHHFQHVLDDWVEDCEGANIDDPLQKHARMLVIGRADYQLMVPFYDMINHRNGKWYNIHHSLDYETQFGQNHTDRPFEIVTSKSVKAGEELYNSYNQCNFCVGWKDWMGTPEMFNLFGFVERMPQRWLFHNVRVKFDLDWKNEDESTGELQVKFHVPPSERGMVFLREELTRLKDFKQRKNVDAADTLVPKSEWESFWQYHNALTVAMAQVLGSGVEVTEEVWERGRYWWVEDGSEPPEDAELVYYDDYMDEILNKTEDAQVCEK
jgi:hypothetical protein